MAKQYVSDLRKADPGSFVNSAFLVCSKEMGLTRQEKPFLKLELADRTGRIPAKVWDDAEHVAALFELDDVVRVEGQIQDWQGELQLVVRQLSRCPESEVDLADFLPRSSRHPAELEAALTRAVESVKQPALRELLSLIFGETELKARFLEAPAAKQIHHAYLGGLAEHAINVVAICELICQLYPELDRDLLVTGALVHDLGKLEEFRYRRSIDYTDAGRLLGHLVMGERLVSKAADGIEGFPPTLKLRLSHLILSHHGAREFGAVQVPQTVEACALHQAENLDAQVNRFLEIAKAHSAAGQPWTGYDRLLERSLFLGTDEEEDLL